MTFNWLILFQNLPELAYGAWQTLIITGVSLLLGMLLGVPICAMNLSGSRWLIVASRGYIAIFRAIPEMVLIFWTYFCLPAITGLTLPGIISGCIGLALASGAYIAEIFRAGIQAIPASQHEASRALALPSTVKWFKIILPQAVKIIIPPFLNYFTELLKNTTLLAAIGVAELAYTAYTLGGVTYRYLEFLSAIGVIYFMIIYPLSRLALVFERRSGSTPAALSKGEEEFV